MCGSAPRRSTDRYSKHIAFCPHYHFGQGIGPWWPFAEKLQQIAIDAVAMQGRNAEKVSCERCPTDYLVVVNGDETIVKAWHDLGTGLSIEDPSWQSHLITDENGLSIGPHFQYEHGGISKMYDSC